jgi:hypothetical protein
MGSLALAASLEMNDYNDNPVLSCLDCLLHQSMLFGSSSSLIGGQKTRKADYPRR